MDGRLLAAALLAGAVLLPAGGALAQQGPSVPNEVQPGVGRTESSPMVKLEDLIGREVRGEDGKELGAIADIVLRPEDRGPSLAVLESGGFLGLGAMQIAIDYQMLEIGRDRIVARSVTQEQVADMPRFEYSDATVSLNHAREAAGQPAEAPKP